MLGGLVCLGSQGGPLTQEVEYLPFKQRVAGSNPARPTNQIHTLTRSFPASDPSLDKVEHRPLKGPVPGQHQTGKHHEDDNSSCNPYCPLARKKVRSGLKHKATVPNPAVELRSFSWYIRQMSN